MNYENYKKLKEIQTYKIFDNIYGMRKEKIVFQYEDIIFVSGIALLSLLRKEIEYDNLIVELEENIKHIDTISLLEELIVTYKKEIEEVSRKYNEDELKATVLFSESKTFSKTGDISTTDGIMQLVIDVLDIKEEDSVLELGSGVNSFLTKVGYSSKSQNLKGIEISKTNIIIGEMRKYITGVNIEITEGNMLLETEIKGDKVFVDSPLGVKIANIHEYIEKNQKLREFFNELKINSTGEWIYGINGYLKTNFNGKTAIIMTNAGTWNKLDENIRQKLVEEGLVEGVIILPSNLLASTAISVTLVVLSEGNVEVKMVDAIELYTKGRRQNTLEEKNIEKILESYRNNTKISKIVKNEDIIKNDYILNPLRYIIGNDIKNPITIGEISKTISRGKSIKSSELDELITKEKTNCQYIILKNIKNGVVEEDLQNLKYIDEKHEKACLKNKNILISKNAPFKIAIVNIDEDKKILCSNNIYALEIDEEKIDPEYVVVYLNSKEGQNQLNRIAKGTVISNISTTDLKKVKIPQMSIEEQKIVVEHCKKINDIIIKRTKKLEDLKKYKEIFLTEKFK